MEDLKIPEYRPGKAEFKVTYENGWDKIQPIVVIEELGDAKFYDELFLGHFASSLPPGEPKEVTVSVFLDDRDKLIEQLREFGYKEVGEGEFEYCGIKIEVL